MSTRLLVHSTSARRNPVAANDESVAPALPAVGDTVFAVAGLSNVPEIAHAPDTGIPGAVARAAAVFGRAACALVTAVLIWEQATDDRRHLMSLDDRTLRDLGLSRLDVGRL